MLDMLLWRISTGGKKDVNAHSGHRSPHQTPRASLAVSGNFCKEDASSIW